MTQTAKAMTQSVVAMTHANLLETAQIPGYLDTMTHMTQIPDDSRRQRWLGPRSPTFAHVASDRPNRPTRQPKTNEVRVRRRGRCETLAARNQWFSGSGSGYCLMNSWGQESQPDARGRSVLRALRISAGARRVNGPRQEQNAHRRGRQPAMRREEHTRGRIRVQRPVRQAR
jgi:hypothetical protein